MMANTMFVICVAFLVSLPFVSLVMTDGPKTRPIPTEAELVLMERMAKIAATAQGECK
jgi:hypothetical protein